MFRCRSMLKLVKSGRDESVAMSTVMSAGETGGLACFVAAKGIT